MDDGKLIRPNQVTLAAWMIIGGSVIVVLSVFDQVAGLRSVEMHAAVEKFLSEPPGEGLGLTVDDALQILKAISLVAAACATATAILGWQVLRRDRSARVALTVLAAPMFVTGLFAGGFFAALVAASAVMLWSQPARDWFNGIRPAPRVATPPPVDAPPPPSAPPVDAPPPFQGYGVSRPPLTVGSLTRPAVVTWAVVLTWVSTALTFLLLLVSGVLVANDSEAILRQARERQPSFDTAGVTDHMLVVMVIVMLVLFAVWALGAALLAWLVWRGRDWARITLIVSAFVAGGISIVGVIAGGVTLPLLVSCGVVIRVLMSPPAVAWCRRRDGAGPVW
jgi:hypothetical protein